MRTNRRITRIDMDRGGRGRRRAVDRRRTTRSSAVNATLPTERLARSRRRSDAHGGHAKEATTLYVWASDQAHVAPDFLAVIDFDRKSPDYGKVLRTVPLPPPGNIGNEPHHCHTSADQTILACGGLLSVLKGQNDIFFFDISDARYPKFLRSDARAQLEHHRRLPAAARRRIPRHQHGVGERRSGRARRGVRQATCTSSPSTRARRRPTAVQSARHRRRFLEEPARHERLHQSR